MMIRPITLDDEEWKPMVEEFDVKFDEIMEARVELEHYLDYFKVNIINKYYHS